MLSERYELIRPIGAGGMGVVYLAMDRKLNKKWAVKEIRLTGAAIASDMSVRESVKAELYALKSLEHRNLPRIVDVCWRSGSAFLVMDYVEGENLKELSLRLGGIAEKQLLSIGIELADTLSYLHTRSEPVIYRDMKPANIIVRSDGSVMLVDLGASRRLSEIAQGTQEGTRRYAAPEQLMGTADVRSDIFSLGKTLRDLLRGRKCSRRLKSILDRCMKENPDARFQSAAEVKYALERAAAGAGARGIAVGAAAAALICAASIICLSTAAQGNEKMETITSESKEYMSAAHNEYDCAMAVHERQEAARHLLVEENYSQVSLGRAILLLEEAGKIIDENEDCVIEAKRSEIMECRIENLSMLSTIYKLLGRKDTADRRHYYEQAEKYIEELFEIESVKGTSLYRLKLSDLVGMKQEQGETDEAVRMLEDWESANPDKGKELYYAHISILLSDAGNEDAVRRLFDRMREIDEVREDFRFRDVTGRVMRYLGQ